MMLRKYPYFILLLLLAGFAASGQDLFYKVYEYETPFIGHVELSLRNTYIASSNNSYRHFGKKIDNKGLFAHSAEIGFGVTDHLEIDAYADFMNADNKKLEYIQSHFSALYRFGQRYDFFINTALYFEYYVPATAYSNSQEAELRLILDKDVEDFRFVLNPTLSKYVTGNEDQSLQPGLNAGIYYRRYAVLQPGVEYYSNFKEKRSVIFPVANIYITPHLVWNIGAGFGLTSASDQLVFKSMLQLDVQAIRPSRLLQRKHKPRADQSFHVIN